MHTAFQLSQLLPTALLGSDTVTAAILHLNQLIVGTVKGDILVFEVSDVSTSSTEPSVKLLERREGFSKKAIDQLGYLREMSALISLSGGDVVLHSLPSFTQIMSLSAQTRASASLFVLSSTNTPPPVAPLPRRTASNTSAMSARPAPEPWPTKTLMAVACKRKLAILTWVNGIWATPIELALPHQIRGMAFTLPPDDPAAKLVAGFSTGEYGIISLRGTPSLGDLFSPIMPTAVTAAVASSLEASASSSRASASLGLAGYTKTGLGGLAKVTGSAMGLSGLGNLKLAARKIDKNGVVAIPKLRRHGKAREAGTEWMFGKEWGWEEEQAETEVVVVRDNVALSLYLSSKPLATPTCRPLASPTSAQAILYPVEPDETVVLAPYIISLLPANASTKTPPLLQVHSMESLQLVQSLRISGQGPSPPASISDASSISSPPSLPTTTVKLLSVTHVLSSSEPALLISYTVVTTTPAASADTVPIAVSEQGIWILRMKPWAIQIEELGTRGEWAEATKLVRQSPSGGQGLSSELLCRLSHLHAMHLFHANLYDLAINAFISLDLSPAKVVALYPPSISGKLFLEPYALEEIFGGRSKELVKASEQETREIAEEEIRAKAEAESKSKALAKLADDDTTSSRSSSPGKFGSKGRQSNWIRREASTVEDTMEFIAQATAAQAVKDSLALLKTSQHNFSRSVDVLIRYLTDRRQKCSLALASLFSSARPLSSTHRQPATAEELRSLPDVAFTRLSIPDLVRVAIVVDTALFMCYLAEKPVLLGSLCRIENWCEVEEVEQLLLDAKRFGELLDLYNGKHLHQKAVQLLRQMSQDETDPEEKVEPTVRYLQKLGSAHLDLIFESSKWIFEVDQNAGLKIFTADLEEVESLPRHATMQHLESIGSLICAAYLEHIIQHLGEQGAEFHEKLIELYLANLPVDDRSSADNNPASPYNRLIDFLETSTAYRADRILGRLPSENLYEVRAILLGRLGRHEGALAIYVNQLQDHATAEEYCARVYESIPSMRPTIFHLLLRLYLLPSSASPHPSSTLSPALLLLANHATSLSPIEVLDLLPPLLPLAKIETFLAKSLRRSTEKKREAKMLEGITRREKDGVENEVVSWEERRVKITETRTCPQCHKRLGNSVIAIHAPLGEVTHYQCREEFMQGKPENM